MNIKESIRMFFKPLLLLKTFLHHSYFAIRYGQWDIGWDKEWGKKPDEPFFYCKTVYYDGNHWGLRVGGFYIGVSY